MHGCLQFAFVYIGQRTGLHEEAGLDGPLLAEAGSDDDDDDDDNDAVPDDADLSGPPSAHSLANNRVENEQGDVSGQDVEAAAMSNASIVDL